MTKKHLFLALAATLLAVFTSCKGEEELDPQNPQDPQGPQAPELVSITPDTGIAGLSATISGKHFSATKEENKVLFGEAEATVAAATDTTLVVLVPENEPGEVKVAVIVGELTSNTLKFIYEVPVVEAKVTAIEPTHASVGDKVTLKGEGFGESKEGYMVLFDETEAVIESVNDTEIVVVVPDTEDGEANVILQKNGGMVPVPQQFSFDFAKILTMGELPCTIFESGKDFEVPVENLASDDEVAVTFVGADKIVEAEAVAGDGVLTVYVPEKLKGDYKLKVYVKGCLPVESAAEFAVYYVPQYQLDLTDPAGYIGGYGSGSHKDGVGSEARFNSTSGVALASDGSLWVTTIGGTISNNTGHAIRKVNPTTKEVTTVIEPDVLTLGKTQNIYPYHGAFASNGDYYAACKNGKFMIGKVSAADNTWSVFECTNTPAKYNDSKDIHFMNLILDAQDNIYVCDRDQSRILKVNAGSTDVAATIQVKATINGEENNIQINHFVWGKNKEQFIVSGADDLVLVLADMSGNGTVIAGNGLKPHYYDGTNTNNSGTTLNFTDGELGNPLSATIGQIGGIFYDEADGYIYFNDINSKAFRVLVPGVGGDYTKGAVKTLLGNPSLSASKEGGLSNLGGLVRMSDGSFYIAANKAISKASPIAE
ncbi:MAG: IPT/TIG domain-containing protein [Bacteroidales bacterium]|nr:IPT/TIG domain-containing protein [Bacteroidales bacterium]